MWQQLFSAFAHPFHLNCLVKTCSGFWNHYLNEQTQSKLFLIQWEKLVGYCCKIKNVCRDQDSNLGYYGSDIIPQRRVLTTRRSWPSHFTSWPRVYQPSSCWLANRQKSHNFENGIRKKKQFQQHISLSTTGNSFNKYFYQHSLPCLHASQTTRLIYTLLIADNIIILLFLKRFYLIERAMKTSQKLMLQILLEPIT